MVKVAVMFDVKNKKDVDAVDRAIKLIKIMQSAKNCRLVLFNEEKK